jgi:hypothetical protein
MRYETFRERKCIFYDCSQLQIKSCSLICNNAYSNAKKDPFLWNPQSKWKLQRLDRCLRDYNGSVLTTNKMCIHMQRRALCWFESFCFQNMTSYCDQGSLDYHVILREMKTAFMKPVTSINAYTLSLRDYKKSARQSQPPVKKCWKPELLSRQTALQYRNRRRYKNTTSRVSTEFSTNSQMVHWQHYTKTTWETSF